MRTRPACALLPRPDQRMDDRVKPAPGLGVAEHHAGQRRPVQGPVRCEELPAERLDDGGEPRSAGLDHLAGDDVGVHDDRPACGQEPGDGALPRPDPAGQPDAQHVRTVATVGPAHVRPPEVTGG